MVYYTNFPFFIINFIQVFSVNNIDVTFFNSPFTRYEFTEGIMLSISAFDMLHGLFIISSLHYKSIVTTGNPNIFLFVFVLFWDFSFFSKELNINFLKSSNEFQPLFLDVKDGCIVKELIIFLKETES